MANKIVDRMMDRALANLARKTGIPKARLHTIILSGDGQRASRDDADAIAKALVARTKTLFVERQEGGWYPRKKKK